MTIVRAEWTLSFFILFSLPTGAANTPCELVAGTSEAHARNGLCEFNTVQRMFTGTPAEQSKCLLQAPTVARTALQQSNVPPKLLALVGTATTLTVTEIGAYLAARHIDEADVGGPITIAISADYFVIHDTSTPNCSEDNACPVLGQFPPDIDSESWAENKTFNHHKPLGAGKKKAAHVITNRVGESITEVDLKDHVSHIKFDYCFDKERKDKLFVGVENIQPRIGRPPIPKLGKRPNDLIAPTPAFSDLQYKRLALIYVIASGRRGHWLVPAYHAVLDWYFNDGHDDPQNFDLSRFSENVAAIAAEIAAH